MDLIQEIRRLQAFWGIPQSVLFKILGIELESQIPSASSVPTLLSIEKSLNHFYPDPDQQLEWMHKPNSTFMSQRPIDCMSHSTQELAWVAYTLETNRQQDIAIKNMEAASEALP